MDITYALCIFLSLFSITPHSKASKEHFVNISSKITWIIKNPVCFSYEIQKNHKMSVMNPTRLNTGYLCTWFYGAISFVLNLSGLFIEMRLHLAPNVSEAQSAPGFTASSLCFSYDAVKKPEGQNGVLQRKHCVTTKKIHPYSGFWSEKLILSFPSFLPEYISASASARRVWKLLPSFISTTP